MASKLLLIFGALAVLVGIQLPNLFVIAAGAVAMVLSLVVIAFNIISPTN